jgi:glycosyltransferase involved in cell wall biosynthesis
MPSTPRILAIVASRVFYGQERANIFVLETMKAAGAEILAVVEDHASYQAIPEQLQQRDIPFKAVPTIGRRHPGYLWDFMFGNAVRLISGRLRLRAIIQDFGPTHIHVPNAFAFIMAWISAPANIHIIYRIGDLPATHNHIWRWIWRRIVRRVEHFVADSNFIAGELEKLGVVRSRISVIYSAPPKRKQGPQPSRMPENFQEILFIGQISPAKGVDRLVSAFRMVANEYPDARLRIVGRISDYAGDKWARDLAHAAMAEPALQGRIFFPGEIDNIFEILASCGFLVVPSMHAEPFGLVVTEAKAAARPAVIFPRGGLPEQIYSGSDGYVCADTSIEALAEGLRYYLGDPDRVRLHGQAALHSLKRMGVEQFAERWRKVYSETK